MKIHVNEKDLNTLAKIFDEILDQDKIAVCDGKDVFLSDGDNNTILKRLYPQVKDLLGEYREQPARLFDGGMRNKCLDFSEDKNGRMWARCVVEGKVIIEKTFDLKNFGLDSCYGAIYSKGNFHRIDKNKIVSRIDLDDLKGSFIPCDKCGADVPAMEFRPLKSISICSECK